MHATFQTSMTPPSPLITDLEEEMDPRMNGPTYSMKTTGKTWSMSNFQVMTSLTTLSSCYQTTIELLPWPCWQWAWSTLAKTLRWTSQDGSESNMVPTKITSSGNFRVKASLTIKLWPSLPIWPEPQWSNSAATINLEWRTQISWRSLRLLIATIIYWKSQTYTKKGIIIRLTKDKIRTYTLTLNSHTSTFQIKTTPYWPEVQSWLLEWTKLLAVTTIEAFVSLTYHATRLPLIRTSTLNSTSMEMIGTGISTLSSSRDSWSRVITLETLAILATSHSSMLITMLGG